ncbi:ATP-binding protein [Brucella pituitosa]|uniref:histidine kinase n=1 Tax=Brucella pituitosa TaxID=571256 RepID=A0ABS3K1U0_9HYPH|nr:ATP-binding protein [Brucella pituitosa]MBO1040883.1 hypothetical protein [Brucella pituitosa]
MNRLKATDRQTLRIYWFASILVFAIALTGAGSMIYRDYSRQMGISAQQAMSLAQTLAEHTTQIFTKIDILSWALMEDYSNQVIDKNLISEVMKRRISAEPAVMGIAIVDKNGQVAASGMDKYPINSDFSGTSEYMNLSKNNAQQVFISKPYLWSDRFPTVSSNWTMNYSRRINSKDGQFDGYVLIIINEAYLYGFYHRLDGTSDLLLGLVGTDGIVRASNDVASIGRKIPQFMEDYVNADGGIQKNVTDAGGARRVFANYQSAAAPLVAYVGVPANAVYKAWIASSAIIVGALIILLTALVVLGVVLSKYVKNRNSLMAAVLEAADLRREREFLETIVNTGAVLMAVTDARGQIVVVNQALHALFPTLEAASSASEFISHILGRSFDKIIIDLPWQGINNIALEDGRKRGLSWSVSPIRNTDGSVKNLVAVGLDITERREAELAIYQSGKLITLGEVATGIAHEINQPLATLSMAIFNLQTRDAEETLDKATIREGLALAASQVDRAASIVKHMRVYGHRSDAALGPLDPVEAIEGVLTMIGAQIEKQGIEIRHRYCRGEFLVTAELVLLEQIVLNLVLNARDAILDKYKDDKTANWQFIELVVCADSEQTVAIKVIDSGPGIPSSIVDRVFEPFFTTKPVGQGTGLGLSLSYGMAREMGGELKAHNGDSGAEFQLILHRATRNGETDNVQ